MKFKSLVFLLLSLFIIQSCSSIPGVKEPSEAEINAESLKAYNEVKAKAKISNNREWKEMVDRVARRIAKASGENFDWEWILIEDPQVNAWCMPGGKMAVYTGIMPILKTEGALAAVMGHEVAHATKRHGKQRYSRAIKGNLIGAVVGGAAIAGGQFLCKTQTCKTLTGLGGAAAGFAVAFFDRKFSRGDETEADHEGQVFMARAGYDPAEAAVVWERMAANNGGKASDEWMSTHPSDKTRMKNLRTWLPQAEAVYSQAPVKYGIGENIR